MGLPLNMFGILVETRTEDLPHESGWMIRETLVYVEKPDAAMSSREDFIEFSCHESLKK
jgi:hypothetical protein